MAKNTKEKFPNKKDPDGNSGDGLLKKVVAGIAVAVALFLWWLSRFGGAALPSRGRENASSTPVAAAVAPGFNRNIMIGLLKSGG